MHNLVYSPRAQKALKKFPKDYQLLIAKKIVQLKNDPKPRGFDKIASRIPPLYRIRVGDYRVFYFIDEENKEVIIVDIKRRTTQTYR
ncbi:MAG: Plasmid stabilization system [Microgenomates group bacterium Gr01-1014_7]|nr:MAG: Plasmid stabilization system [Microgenomates group bacterium Gr01-1014_7]